MVAPAEGTPRKQKWRGHCSTCGALFPKPQLWAYCSKSCEDERRGLDHEGTGTDEWLTVLHDERLRLRVELESAAPGDRARLVAAILVNEAREDTVRDELAVITAPRDSALFWVHLLQRDADRFEASMRRGLAMGIRLGRRLLAAKAALPHGEFGRLFAGHDDAVVGALSLSPRHAQRLMSIAEHPLLGHATHVSHLPIPADIESVYLLSRLPADDLTAAIERGDVTPEMRRADARDLLPPAADEPAEPIDHVARAIEPICRHLRRFAAEHASQFGELRARLRAALRAIEGEVTP